MSRVKIDVLCIGTASYDLVFPVSKHPDADEKMVSESLVMCGGGPAANAAMTVSRLGGTSAFAGYLGEDAFGDQHMAELTSEGVNIDLIVRGQSATPLSVILVKPNGDRSLVNYGIKKDYLPRGSIDFSRVVPSVILLDGHQPLVSMDGLDRFKGDVFVVLDAGSVHPGTEMLLDKVDCLVCSEKFSNDWTGESDPLRAALVLAGSVPTIVITLGERGLVWKDPKTEDSIRAFEVNAVDTTGAGDVFHGAFALGIARGWEWEKILRFSSAAAALCCTKLGARQGIPKKEEVESFLH